MKAFLMRYGTTSSSEFDEMNPHETRRLVMAVRKLRDSEIELEINLAKLVAGARLGQAPEVR